ncbi:class I adenylate-forming enzyme family protein [Paraburkholderia diazotrophica]|uniref:Acyl-CoA synthetase (AMP-forming)/AMP-acid ligase II n=1 Tax=Paraburkholderia diazotrophica TaxID=667676 RepID=A0A1H6WWH3_9BURK|nr:class I adenylate-forming enzyme family protein [Paraburkholderia diazotrophica]SEJ19654.1 Acyl-CoA synthetase (AMP-forming)/AMP-acid ligase II [Paraburkholderia diazotrophica]
MIAIALACACALVLVWLVFVLREFGLVHRLASLRCAKPPLGAILEKAAAQYGDQTIVELDEPLDWADSLEPSRTAWSATMTLDAVHRLSAAIASLSLSANDRVAIYKRNAFDIFLFSVAANRVGGIAAPINANLDGATALAYLDRIGASIAIVDRASLIRLVEAGAPGKALRALIVTCGVGDACIPASWAHSVRFCSLDELLSAEVPDVKAVVHGDDDPLYIFHTSGTTGVPKGVIVCAGGMAQSLRSVLLFNLVSTRDFAYFALPLNHQVSHLYFYALFLLRVRAMVGAHFDVNHALETIKARRITVFFAFPVTYTRLLAALTPKHDLSSIRIWGTTADASHEIHQRTLVKHGSFFRRIGIPLDGSLFIDGLGSTEVGIAALLRIVTPWTRTFGRRVGRPTPGGPKIKVVDETGRDVVRGTPGRLMIKGPCMFRGYWNAHDLLVQSTRNGWWFTGDIVCRAKGGEFIHLDREVDVVRGPHHVTYTLPVEEVILNHPAVLDVSVFGVRVPAGHQAPAALVALRAGSAPYCAAALLAEINTCLPVEDRLAQLWIEPWSVFPLGATGKTLRRKLRERFPSSTSTFAGKTSTDAVSVRGQADADVAEMSQ